MKIYLLLFFTVPEDSPTNVVITDLSSSSVLITWTPPSIPNGEISYFTLYIDYTDGSAIVVLITGSNRPNYTLEGLQPYQLVAVQVSASTSAGEGPKSNASEGRASEEGMKLV